MCNDLYVTYVVAVRIFGMQDKRKGETEIGKKKKEKRGRKRERESRERKRTSNEKIRMFETKIHFEQCDSEKMRQTYKKVM